MYVLRGVTWRTGQTPEPQRNVMLYGNLIQHRNTHTLSINESSVVFFVKTTTVPTEVCATKKRELGGSQAVQMLADVRRIYNNRCGDLQQMGDLWVVFLRPTLHCI